jgi:hypothetical protein
MTMPRGGREGVQSYRKVLGVNLQRHTCCLLTPTMRKYALHAFVAAACAQSFNMARMCNTMRMALRTLRTAASARRTIAGICIGSVSTMLM